MCVSFTPAIPFLIRFHTFLATAIALSLRNADFMLGIHLATDVAPSFLSTGLFSVICYLFTRCLSSLNCSLAANGMLSKKFQSKTE